MPGTRIVRPVLFGIRSRRHDEVGAAAGQDPQRSGLAERMVRLGRPDAGRVDDGPGRDLELAAVEQVGREHRLDAAPCPGSARMPVARTRVTRDGAGGHRGPARRRACTARRPRPRRGRAAAAQARRWRSVGASSSVVGPRQAPVPAAVAPGAEDVVERQAGVVERLGRDTACRRSGRAAARGGRGAARASAAAIARPGPRGRAPKWNCSR